MYRIMNRFQLHDNENAVKPVPIKTIALIKHFTCFNLCIIRFNMIPCLKRCYIYDVVVYTSITSCAKWRIGTNIWYEPLLYDYHNAMLTQKHLSHINSIRFFPRRRLRSSFSFLHYQSFWASFRSRSIPLELSPYNNFQHLTNFWKT